MEYFKKFQKSIVGRASVMLLVLIMMLQALPDISYTADDTISYGMSSGIANVTTTNPFKIGRSLEGTGHFTPDALFDDPTYI